MLYGQVVKIMRGAGQGVAKMRETGEQTPGVMARTVCGAAGLAATLVRLSAGIAAVACLGYFMKERMTKRGKKKKNASAPTSPGKWHLR